MKNKFNQKVFNEIIENRKKGLPLYICAYKAGISVKTLYRWLKAGENPKNRKHGFYLDMKKARQEYFKHEIDMKEHLSILHRLEPNYYPSYSTLNNGYNIKKFNKK